MGNGAEAAENRVSSLNGSGRDVEEKVCVSKRKRERERVMKRESGDTLQQVYILSWGAKLRRSGQVKALSCCKRRALRFVWFCWHVSYKNRITSIN